MAKNAFKFSTMVGEIFQIYMSQMAKTAFKFSTMVGENFQIYISEIARVFPGFPGLSGHPVIKPADFSHDAKYYQKPSISSEEL